MPDEQPIPAYEPKSDLGNLLLALFHASAHNGPYLFEKIDIVHALKVADSLSTPADGNNF